MSKFDEQLSRMRALCTYGTVNEDKKQSNYTLEYHATAADGKEYGIIKECSHFYIKSTTPDKKNLAESYQYIGGWANKKNYEYESYNNALKNFELKLESINEAHDSKVNVETLDPFKKENLVVEGTEAMKNEIARQRQIMYNAAMLMNESTDYAVKGGEACSTSQPEAEAGEKGDKAKGSKEVKADPNYKGSKIDLDKKAAPFEENPKGINEVASPNEGDFDEGAKPFGTAQNGEADTEHNNSPFTKNVNESEEDDKSEDVKDDDVEGNDDVADDDFDFDFDEESEESFDDDVADDEPVDDELATDTDLDAGVEDVDDDFASDDDVDFPSVGDGDELGGDSDLASKIADLETQLAALKAQVEDCDKDIAADDVAADDATDDDVEVNDDLAGEDGTDVEDDVDFGDEEDFEDEDDFEDFGEDDEESFDDDDDDEMYEAKKKVMDRIVESVVRQALKEDELHDFGKHPGYRKKPMDLPTTGQDKNEHGEDINDDSVHNEEPFGKQIGDGSPFNQLVDAVTKDVMYQLKKGAPIEGENKKKE